MGSSHGLLGTIYHSILFISYNDFYLLLKKTEKNYTYIPPSKLQCFKIAAMTQNPDYKLDPDFKPPKCR